MGEAKRKAVAAAVRPDEAILRLKASIGASAAFNMDAETKAFMADLTAAMGWIDHLEKKPSDETPVTVN